MSISTNKQLNELAIKLTDCLSTMDNPVQQHEFMRAIISNTVFNIPILFDGKLSKIETACLYMAGIGYTSKETAELLNIQPSTVDSHRQGILRKLNCRNMTHAIYKAISNSMVDVIHDIDWPSLKA